MFFNSCANCLYFLVFFCCSSANSFIAFTLVSYFCASINFSFNVSIVAWYSSNCEFNFDIVSWSSFLLEALIWFISLFILFILFIFLLLLFDSSLSWFCNFSIVCLYSFNLLFNFSIFVFNWVFSDFNCSVILILFFWDSSYCLTRVS